MRLEPLGALDYNVSNMPLSMKPYKGARDFYPDDKQLQNYMFDKMRVVAKRYGYREYDAPLLEPIELYKAKSGQEIVDEQIYSFFDRGGREIVIRPEMTPSVSRMVAARRQELAYPLRLFSIPNLWRYERPQKGRLREHWQLNVDVFGIDNVAAEHELIMLADNLLKELGAQAEMYEIRINSRSLFKKITQQMKLDQVSENKLMKLLDKAQKISKVEMLQEINSIKRDLNDNSKDLLDRYLLASSIAELPGELSKCKEAAALDDLHILLIESGITNIKIDLKLMRGFDYYTDAVFEVYDTDPSNNRSMFGGGRYDGLVGMFGVEPVPTAGFGMGDVTLLNFLTAHNLLPDCKSEIDIHLIMIGDILRESFDVAGKLRGLGLNVSVDTTARKLDKRIKSAKKQGSRYIIFVGEDEVQTGQFSIRDLSTGKEVKHPLDRLPAIIEDGIRS